MNRFAKAMRSRLQAARYFRVPNEYFRFRAPQGRRLPVDHFL
jgi:hypothetical protein